MYIIVSPRGCTQLSSFRDQLSVKMGSIRWDVPLSYSKTTVPLLRIWIDNLSGSERKFSINGGNYSTLFLRTFPATVKNILCISCPRSKNILHHKIPKRTFRTR
jgi:hypothetical protein